MRVNNTIEVVGLKDALRELNTIDKKLRRAVTADFKQLMEPAVNDGRRLVPKRAPLSGFNRGWDPRPGRAAPGNGTVLPWSGDDAARSIKPFVSGKRPKVTFRYTKNLATMGMKWTSKEAVLFDTAGNWNTPQGRRMVQVLTERYGPPSRLMWKAYTQAEPYIQAELQDLINRVFAATGRGKRI